MRASEFTNVLLEGYKEAVAEFSEQTSNEEVQDTISKYKDLVNRNQVQGNERNIDYWRKQGWQQFKQFVDTKSQEKSKTQIKRKKAIGSSINLLENDHWLVVIPLDKDASCFHGKHSDWCTTKPNQSHFEEYFYNREVVLIYCLHKETGGMWAIAGHEKLEQIEMFDQKDNSLTEAQFKQQTGLNPVELVQTALKHYGKQLTDIRTNYQDIKRATERAVIGAETRNAGTEKNIVYLKDKLLAATYVHYLVHNKQDVNQLPEIIKQLAVVENPALIPNFSNLTEQTLIAAVKAKGKAISYIKDPSDKVLGAALTAWPYIIDQLVDLPRETIVKFPEAASYYAFKHKTRLPEAEPAIAKSAMALIRYLRVRPGRWPEAEPTILTSPMLITSYVDDNLDQKPWPEGEQALLDLYKQEPIDTVAYYLGRYAEIIGKRWPAAEEYIKQHLDTAADYAINVLDKRWPDIEPELLRQGPGTPHAEAATKYADYFRIEKYFDQFSDEMPEDEVPEWYKERYFYDYD